MKTVEKTVKQYSLEIENFEEFKIMAERYILRLKTM